MKAPTRLGLYALVLAAVFAVSFVTAGAVVPEETVQNWAEATPQTEHDAEGEAMNTTGHDGDADNAPFMALGVANDGYQLTAVTATTDTNTNGQLTVSITGPDGKPVTDFDVDHDKELHLIVVRSDGQHFRHVHPTINGAGIWSIPWQWDAAGTYRVFADFVPAATGEATTLSTSLQVAGDYTPVATDPSTTTTADGYTVSVEGDLVAGESSELTMTITDSGEPVTSLEPYLGAFGHLVALREGDLAYLHVHPSGEEPRPGETSGPEIMFEASTPTSGRYLLFLDFQIDGQVHTASLVLDTTDEQDDSGTSTDNGQHANTDEEEGGS